MLVADKLFVTFMDDLGRNQQVFWSFSLAPDESIELCYIANRLTQLFHITPYNVRCDLFVLDIVIADQSQLMEPIPLSAFENHFALPKMPGINPGEQIIIEVSRIELNSLKPLKKTRG